MESAYIGLRVCGRLKSCCTQHTLSSSSISLPIYPGRVNSSHQSYLFRLTKAAGSLLDEQFKYCLPIASPSSHHLPKILNFSVVDFECIQFVQSMETTTTTTTKRLTMHFSGVNFGVKGFMATSIEHFLAGIHSTQPLMDKFKLELSTEVTVLFLLCLI